MLDPALRHASGSGPSPKRKDKKKKGNQERRSKEELERIVSILDELDLPNITPTKGDLDDLELIDNLTQAQNGLERLKDIEAEIVNNSKWNHDAAEALLGLTSKAKKIPFGTRAELFDLVPTVEQVIQEPSIGQGPSKISTKGKEREANPSQRRSIYNVLPADGEDTWLRSPGKLWNPQIWMRSHSTQHSEPMENDKSSVTYEELLNDAFPDLFAAGAAHHNCAYRHLLAKFVEEDLKKQTSQRLEG